MKRRGGRTNTSRCVLHTLQQSAFQTAMLQQNRPSLIVSFCDEISLHFCEWFTTFARAFRTLLPIYPSYHTSSPGNLSSSASGKSHCISVRHLSLMLVSFWIANVKWCWEVISAYLTTKSIKEEAIAPLLTDHRGDLICSSVLKQKAALFCSEGLRMSPVSLGWFEEQWSGCSIDWIMRLCASESSPPPLSLTKTPSPSLPSSLMELIYA